MSYVEGGEYLVTATLKVNIPFSPIERDTRLTREDAVVNAVGTVPHAVWEALRDEGWTISMTAQRIS